MDNRFFEYLREKERLQRLQKFIPIREFISCNLSLACMVRFNLPEKIGNDGYFSFEFGSAFLKHSGYKFLRIMN